MAIVISAASMIGGNVEGVMDLAKGLEPLYGNAAKYFMGIGLFAAGITSAVTAPLAAAYVAKGCFNWDADLRSWKFRAVWIGILVFGVVVSSLELKPVLLITFAQVANGLLLPIIAFFLIWIVNRSKIMGTYKNTLFQNILGGLIIIITLILGIKGIITAFS
jgi:Mn2+/Fe2+ NRAMP family transporter